ncbi:TetR/AcrR family transcriptional regulator [Tomitella gaofuii]|uniref:TetR/AcrR family transcriptional regulator n=1 Tax=Tomitella gaofuii TaxID=2760083 RepID=UPI0015FDE8D7|nr:TetR/AcrR family transcriptional regulator [Tomitella gaofuii]
MVRQERAEATRRQILDAAATVFSRDGYVAANLGEIVTHAGVTKGALYFHFDSKGTLARAIIADRDLRVAHARRMIAASNLPPLEDLIQQSLTVAALVYTDAYVRAGDRLVQEIGEAGAEAGVTSRAVRAQITALLAAAAEGGDARVDDPAAVARVLWAQFCGARVAARLAPDEFDLIDGVEDMWAMVIDSIITEDLRGYFRQVVTRAAGMYRTATAVSAEADGGAEPA